MADTTKTVEIIFQGTNQLGTSIATLEDQLGGIGDDAKFAGEGVGDLNAEVGLLGTAGVASIGLLGKAFAAIGVGLLASRFVEANSSLETFQRTLVFATGSTQAAADEWQYVTEVAERFGIGLQDTASAYSKFIAGTSGATLSTEELKTTFEGVAGTLSLVGLSSTDVAESLRQMTQGIGKNRFELEDLKSIAERIPGGMYAIAESLDITTAELYKMITAGEFGAEQIAIFGKALEEGLDGAKFDTFNNEVERLGTAIDQLAISAGESGAFDLLVFGVEAATAAVKNLGETFSNDLVLDDTEITQLTEQLGKSSIEWNALTGIFGNAWTDAATKTKAAAGDIAGALEEITVQSQRIENPDIGGFFDIGDELSNFIDQDWADPFDELKGLDPFEDVREGAKKTRVEIGATQDTLLTLASNEKIANIEAVVSLNIAEVEANAKIAVSIIEGLSETITSTSDNISSLFGNLADADSLREKFSIEAQLKKENEIRDKAAEQQIKLSDAQIRYLNAQARALDQGGAIVTVNGDGLQPHLEAIMFELLSAIQVRVNAQGYEMLLGVP